MNRIPLQKLTTRAIAACLFGAAFWLMTVIGQGQLSSFTGGSDCCQRCTDFLYHSAQPILTFCAAAAFFCQSFIPTTAGRAKRLALKGVVCWLCFQVFSVWTAWHLLHRTPCTALYSPGPVFLIGAAVVLVVLLIESTVWMLICGLMILVIEGIKAAIRREDHFSLSIRT